MKLLYSLFWWIVWAITLAVAIYHFILDAPESPWNEYRSRRPDMPAVHQQTGLYLYLS